MAKRDKYMEGRDQGMAFALEIARKSGVEGLEEECRRRNLINLKVPVTTQELNEATETIKCNLFTTVRLAACVALQDGFGFGKKRLSKFIAEFNDKQEVVGNDGIAAFEYFAEQLREEVNLNLVYKLE